MQIVPDLSPPPSPLSHRNSAVWSQYTGHPEALSIDWWLLDYTLFGSFQVIIVIELFSYQNTRNEIGKKKVDTVS